MNKWGKAEPTSVGVGETGVSKVRLEMVLRVWDSVAVVRRAVAVAKEPPGAGSDHLRRRGRRVRHVGAEVGVWGAVVLVRLVLVRILLLLRRLRLLRRARRVVRCVRRRRGGSRSRLVLGCGRVLARVVVRKVLRELEVSSCESSANKRTHLEERRARVVAREDAKHGESRVVRHLLGVSGRGDRLVLRCVPARTSSVSRGPRASSRGSTHERRMWRRLASGTSLM